MEKLVNSTSCLSKPLLEKPSLRVLQDYSDASLYLGIKNMEEILHNSEFDADTKIKATNAIISAARYIEIRKVNERVEKPEIEYDDVDLIINTAEEVEEN